MEQEEGVAGVMGFEQGVPGRCKMKECQVIWQEEGASDDGVEEISCR